MTSNRDQPTSRAQPAGRKKYPVARLAMFAAIAIVAFLSPKFDAWLDDLSAPNAVDAPEKQLVDSAAPDTGVRRKSVEKTADGPGKLTLVQGTRDEFRSTAGLLYVRGSVDGHRLKHVLKHTQDDMSKPVHGVFTGNRDQILAWIDRAYSKAQNSDRHDQGVRTERQSDRTVYTVDLGEKIGYTGGFVGKRKGNPECRGLKLVVEENSEVVTSYPVQTM